MGTHVCTRVHVQNGEEPEDDDTMRIVFDGVAAQIHESLRAAAKGMYCYAYTCMHTHACIRTYVWMHKDICTHGVGVHSHTRTHTHFGEGAHTVG